MEYEIPKGKAKFLKGGGAYLLKGANLLGISPPGSANLPELWQGGGAKFLVHWHNHESYD
jgi:hypothetical protein